jgi:hypothetical protein
MTRADIVAAATGRLVARESVDVIGSLPWLVDGNSAAVFYDLDVDMTRTDASNGLVVRGSGIPAYVAERFTVADGAVVETERAYAPAMVGGTRPPRALRYPRARGVDAPPRDEVVALASAYLDALVRHDGSSVPLAPLAWRVENGRNTGDSGAEIARALDADIMQVVTGVRELVWCVEDDTAIVFYTLDVDPSRLPGASDPGAGGEAATATSARRLAERFRVHAGLLTEIEVVIPTGDM